MADDSRTNVENASQTPIEEKNEPEDHRPALSDLPWKYKTIIILSLLTLSGKISSPCSELRELFRLTDQEIQLVAISFPPYLKS